MLESGHAKWVHGKRMGGHSRHQAAGIASVVSGILGAPSICMPVLLDVSPTLAQAIEPRALNADIPAEPVANAFEAFAVLRLLYVSGVVRDQRSHAVSAGTSANEACRLQSQPLAKRVRRAVCSSFTRASRKFKTSSPDEFKRTNQSSAAMIRARAALPCSANTANAVTFRSQ
jgi:hypothetical protein